MYQIKYIFVLVDNKYLSSRYAIINWYDCRVKCHVSRYNLLSVIMFGHYITLLQQQCLTPKYSLRGMDANCDLQFGPNCHLNVRHWSSNSSRGESVYSKVMSPNTSYTLSHIHSWQCSAQIVLLNNFVFCSWEGILSVFSVIYSYKL